MREWMFVLITLFAVSLITEPAFALTGGPDAFGYQFIDSNEASGPVYNWIEIAPPAGGSGTALVFSSADDDHVEGLPISFAFPFYGNLYNTFSVGSNGVVYFDSNYLGLNNTCIPGDNPLYGVNRFIAPLWDDLVLNSLDNSVFYQDFGSYLVIEFYDVRYFGGSDYDRFEVILYNTGDIVIQYNETSASSVNGDHTIGIQENATLGLEYSCNTSGSVSNGLVVQFTRGPVPSIPTVSEWGMIIMTSGLLIVGAVMIRRRSSLLT